MKKPWDRGEDNMKENIMALLGLVMLLGGIALVLCVPYVETIQLWNVRVGGIIGAIMVGSSIVIMGVLSEKR